MLIGDQVLHSGDTGGGGDSEAYMIAPGEYTNLVVDTDTKEMDKKTGLPICRVDIFYV